MRVAVGNEQARDFKAMSVPFSIGANEEGLWNSLAVIDTGIVVAVSGIGDNIEMIKGYPVRQLQAPFASPTIDGKLTAGEGYKTRTATQILLGTQTGTRVTADMAYDRDSLYVVARVSDRTQVTSQMRPYTWMEMRLGEMGEETGIEEPTPTAHPLPLPKGGETYDLLGHKVNSRSSLLATPSSKILIRNGKKYVTR